MKKKVISYFIQASGTAMKSAKSASVSQIDCKLLFDDCFIFKQVHFFRLRNLGTNSCIALR